MDQVSHWLQQFEDPSVIDPSLLEFENWSTVNSDLHHGGDDAKTPADTAAEARPSVATSPQAQPTATTAQDSAPVRQGQSPSSTHDTSHAAISIPVQGSADSHDDQYHPMPNLDLQNYGDLFPDLKVYGEYSDLYGNGLYGDNDQDALRSPSRHHYPDPTTQGGHYTNPLDPSSHFVPGPYLPEAQHQPPNMDGFGQQYYGDNQQMFVPPQTDFSFSPTPDFVQPLSAADDPDDVQASSSRARQQKGRDTTASAASPVGGTPKENPSCIDCGKKYRTSSSPGRCTRCGAKYERRVAQPFEYTLDASVPDYAAARRQIFSPIEGRQIYQDDVHRYVHDPSAENGFVQVLLDAINEVQSQENGWDAWSARQQKVFNEKAKLEPGYTNPLVTARLRALYREVLNYHLGGDAVYAVGGDNSGYSDDRTLRFSQRLATIRDILRKNKRVVMDVVEGRGVQGFVSNPRKYHERKASNNNCNVEKKRIMEKGKEIEAELGSVATTTTRRGKRARTAEAASPMTAADEFEEGPSEKRVRIDDAGNDQSIYSPEYEGNGYGSGKPMQAAWLSGFGRRG